MKFIHTKICPLCSKKLNNRFDGKLQKFYCQEFYYKPAGWQDYNVYNYDRHARKVREPHYSVTIDSIKDKWIQSSIITPYHIITDIQEQRTKIYKFPYRVYDAKIVWPPAAIPQGNDEDGLIMEIPIIVPSDYLPEVFATKIRNLVLFS